jgi:hypothetical protein
VVGMPRFGAVRFGDHFFRTPNRIGVRCGSGAVRVKFQHQTALHPEPQITTQITTPHAKLPTGTPSMTVAASTSIEISKPMHFYSTCGLWSATEGW